MVLCVAPTLLNAPAALLCARFSGAQTWLHIQDFEVEAALNLGLLPGGRALARMAAGIERAVIDGFDHVSTISTRMMARLEVKHIPTAKRHLLPNWVDTHAIYPIDPSERRLRQELGFTDQQVVALYAGNLGHKQGLEIVLEAAKLLAGLAMIQFVICGDGAARVTLQSAAQGLSNLKFLPVQPRELLNELLNLADIHLMPQKADAADLVMPSKLAGMLASGKPVIATALPHTGVGEIISQVGVLIPPEDAQAMAGAIRSLAAALDERQRLGAAGRAYAQSHWERERVLSELNDEIISWLEDFDTRGV